MKTNYASYRDTLLAGFPDTLPPDEQETSDTREDRIGQLPELATKEGTRPSGSEQGEGGK